MGRLVNNTDKGSMFYVVTIFGAVDARDTYGKEIISFETIHFLEVHGHYYKFEEEVADKLVAGLTALNSRKVKVENNE